MGVTVSAIKIQGLSESLKWKVLHDEHITNSESLEALQKHWENLAIHVNGETEDEPAVNLAIKADHVDNNIMQADAVKEHIMAAHINVYIQDVNIQGNDDGNVTRQNVHVSPQCAAVVIVSSGAVGAGIALVLAPIVMEMAGFSTIGPEAGSWAAAWQSTMPHVTEGSLFAELQSAAMAGVGTKTTLSGALFGGVVGATLITRICTAVDTVKPDSPEAKVVTIVYNAVRSADNVVKDAMQEAKSIIEALYASGWEQRLLNDFNAW
eukprot:CAMPEP_0181323416 /NCGR_PEP_ID=MMETSP1101-20121128/19774_1 /TAXON_ID=46948 /ORGANISM="Rhodomonas abbreviata, Strain Caron Lab Isolate" /LENGTH=264 /DNA_ID=CAMNT_0023431443 /DNA_START=180 /DNA_END=971 /DNA_ORIENTATION=+